MAQCMRRTRQLPTKHIQFVMVISEKGVKQAVPEGKKQKKTYSTREMVRELPADVSV